MPQSERSEILKQLLKWLVSLEKGATAAEIRQHVKCGITELGASDNTIRKYIEDLKGAGLIEYEHPFWKVTKFGRDWLDEHCM